MVFRLGLLWGVVVLLVAVGLLWIGKVPGGHHWAFFGTPLDVFMHRERFWLVPAIVAPLLVATLLLLAWHRDVQFTIMLCMFSLCAAVTWLLVFIALE